MYKIKQLRQERGMSRKELSEKSGVSNTTLYWLENNIKQIAMSKTLLSIAKVLNVSVNDLFFEE